MRVLAIYVPTLTPTVSLEARKGIQLLPGWGLGLLGSSPSQVPYCVIDHAGSPHGRPLPPGPGALSRSRAQFSKGQDKSHKGRTVGTLGWSLQCGKGSSGLLMTRATPFSASGNPLNCEFRP